MGKALTWEEISRRQQAAVNFLNNVVGDSEKADEIENLSVEEYAARKNFALANPSLQLRRTNKMATPTDTRTKAEIFDSEQEALGILDDIWNLHVDVDDETSKEDLFEASDDTSDILNEYDPIRFPIDETSEDDDAENEEAA